MINIELLPFVYFSQKETLTKESGVYFVVNSGKLIYIGKADYCDGIRGRFKNHNKNYIFENIENLKLHYLIIDSLRLKFKTVEHIERGLIWYYKPTINTIYKTFKKSYDLVFNTEYGVSQRSIDIFVTSQYRPYFCPLYDYQKN